MRIDQYLPGFAPHDAIGNHTLQTRRVLRRAGYQVRNLGGAHPPPWATRPSRTWKTPDGRRGSRAALPVLDQLPDGQLAARPGGEAANR